MRSDEQAIRELVVTWHEATAAGEVSRILSLMADDVVYPVPGRPPMRGRQSFGEGLGTLLWRQPPLVRLPLWFPDDEKRPAFGVRQ